MSKEQPAITTKADAAIELHEWEEWPFVSRTMTCCRKCGIIRRPGKMPEGNDDKPCKGIVQVGFR